jgi:hypothetical protein
MTPRRLITRDARSGADREEPARQNPEQQRANSPIQPIIRSAAHGLGFRELRTIIITIV